jgi:hypothetical protein
VPSREQGPIWRGTPIAYGFAIDMPMPLASIVVAWLFNFAFGQGAAAAEGPACSVIFVAQGEPPQASAFDRRAAFKEIWSAFKLAGAPDSTVAIRFRSAPGNLQYEQLKNGRAETWGRGFEAAGVLRIGPGEGGEGKIEFFTDEFALRREFFASHTRDNAYVMPPILAGQAQLPMALPFRMGGFDHVNGDLSPQIEELLASLGLNMDLRQREALARTVTVVRSGSNLTISAEERASDQQRKERLTLQFGKTRRLLGLVVFVEATERSGTGIVVHRATVSFKIERAATTFLPGS